MGILSRSRPALAWLAPLTRRVGGARPGTDTGGARRGVYVATPTDQEKRYPMYERLRATAGNENTAEKARSPLKHSTRDPDVLPIAKSFGKRPTSLWAAWGACEQHRSYTLICPCIPGWGSALGGDPRSAGERRCPVPRHVGMRGAAKRSRPGGNPGANHKSISHRCHPILVAFVWDLTKETIDLPLGCSRVAVWGCEVRRSAPEPRFLL